MATVDLPQSVYLLAPAEVSSAIAPICSACYEQLSADFASQGKSKHTLATDPDRAHLILAPIWSGGYGPCFELLRKTELYRAHAAKLVVYSPDDNQFPALRGLYPAAPRSQVRRGWSLPAHYISSHIHQFQFTAAEVRQKDLLFSFVGSSRTHLLRERILNWKHPRGLVIDATSKSEEKYWWQRPEKTKFIDAFREVAARSQFVICPRGISPSSIRLYEAMEAAAVPVILSDELELPVGPDWETFCLRVPEREVDRTPRLIEAQQDRAREMGAAARSAWELYFSPQNTVQSVISWATLLLNYSARRPPLLKLEEYTSYPQLRAKLRFATAHKKLAGLR